MNYVFLVSVLITSFPCPCVYFRINNLCLVLQTLWGHAIPVLPQFIPLPPESRVVLPPVDEPGQGETRVPEVGDDVDRGFEALGRPAE